MSRQHHALESKRGAPGNLETQLDLFFQDNNNGTRVPGGEYPAF
ncbi:hypothetical protein [Anabaena sp. CS-542/02]|nr:hypothetical protein [Anabaena sp. CS-542/02]MDB9447675.1 hypothetical protein [Anabaena sp. CS-542/02]